ncbi:hypothetical protein DMENIID0001_054610 [Sergentomyia squamirostris]
MVTSQLFPVVGLIQTNFISPTYYRIPGIPSTSMFFYPVNIIGQFFLFWCEVAMYIAMDCLFLIYLFYFRGEIQSITAVGKLLSGRDILRENCDRILRCLYRSHQTLLQEFSRFSVVLWHFYCHKLLAVILLTCSASFAYSKTSSIVMGVILQIQTIALLAILCTPGQLLDNSSEELSETLYDSLWYEMKPKDQRNFLLIFKGAQRNIKAETMGIDKISFSTLVQGLKTAISYATFIYTVLL